MKVELTIARTIELPKGAVTTLEKELLKRLQNQFDECSLVIHREGSDGLSVYDGEKDSKKKVEEISSRPGKAQMTGFIETACDNFLVGRKDWWNKRRITKQGLRGHQMPRWSCLGRTALISRMRSRFDVWAWRYGVFHSIEG